jgi:hypothetical protein
MPTKIYTTDEVELVDGTVIEVSPLKIKYMRQFMDVFDTIKEAKTDEESIAILSECVRIAMKQYHPVIKTIEDLEDSVDLPTIYKIIDICAGVKINTNEQTNEPMPQTAKSKNENTWEKLDLIKLESEIFLLGIWKNYDELERNISMPELMAILESKRDLDYVEKKFLAAMQGVDLDEASGKQEEDPWEAMKARVAAQASGIGNGDPNDITSLQGQKAQQYGFGIGMGLDYEVVSK